MRKVVARSPRKSASGPVNGAFEQDQAEYIAAALQGIPLPVRIGRLDVAKVTPPPLKRKPRVGRTSH